MKCRSLVLALALPLSAGAACAQGFKEIRVALIGYHEVPAVSTVASGELVARIADDDSALSYTVSYRDLEGDVLQSHIHFGQPGVNGGISVFLCTNLGNGPAGTPPCPASPGSASGTLVAGDVVGPAAQGIAPGELAELIAALRAGVTYVNVHSTKWPGGEIRSPIGPGKSN